MKKFPETSMEAYLAQTPEKLKSDHQRIIAALKVLGTATAEQIADFLNSHEAGTAGRRMSELERKQLVFKTGEKRKTKRNHNAFVYCLTNNHPKTDEEDIVHKPPKKAKEQTNNYTQLSLL